VEGSCEQGNEPSCFIKGWEFLEWLRNWRLLRRSQLHGVSYYYSSRAGVLNLSCATDPFGSLVKPMDPISE
jgi:hypothetical protein